MCIWLWLVGSITYFVYVTYVPNLEKIRLALVLMTFSPFYIRPMSELSRPSLFDWLTPSHHSSIDLYFALLLWMFRFLLHVRMYTDKWETESHKSTQYLQIVKGNTTDIDIKCHQQFCPSMIGISCHLKDCDLILFR